MSSISCDALLDAWFEDIANFVVNRTWESALRQQRSQHLRGRGIKRDKIKRDAHGSICAPHCRERRA
eukprot:155455-Chlamydomonas_euryale.AAC.2